MPFRECIQIVIFDYGNWIAWLEHGQAVKKEIDARAEWCVIPDLIL